MSFIRIDSHNVDKNNIAKVVHDKIQSGSTVKTDGWQAYNAIKEQGLEHQKHILGNSRMLQKRCHGLIFSSQTAKQCEEPIMVSAKSTCPDTWLNSAIDLIGDSGSSKYSNASLHRVLIQIPLLWLS